MEDINALLNEAQAAAAREAAIRRDREQREAREAWEAEQDAIAAAAATAPASGAIGVLTVERQQGQWRCSLAGERIRSGQEVEVYVNAVVGWVRGRLFWARSPHTPPSIRVTSHHPDARGPDGRPLEIGEIELQLPEDAVCRWPPADAP
jgi:hypothetical protein